MSHRSARPGRSGRSALLHATVTAFDGLMSQRVVILGGGTGGTLVANRLRRIFDADELHITVVDQDDRHVYQPGLLFVPFGLTPLGGHRPAHERASCCTTSSSSRRPSIGSTSEANNVHLTGGQVFAYDVLVVAIGCDARLPRRPKA